MAVFGAGAAATYLLALRRGDRPDTHDSVDERLDALAAAVDSKRTKKPAGSSLSHSGSGRVQRLASVVFNELESDDELQTRLSENINPSLSPSDNAAALLHLLMSATSLSLTDRAVLAYAIKALKVDQKTNTLPSALLGDSLVASPAPKIQRVHARSCPAVSKVKTVAQGIIFAQKLSKSFNGITDDDTVVYSWLRSEYSTYRDGAGPSLAEECATKSNATARSMAFERRPHCPPVMSGVKCYDPQTPEEINAINEALEGVDRWDWEVLILLCF